MMQGSSFANSLLTGGIIYVHPLVTVEGKDSDSAHADLLKAPSLEVDSSAPPCMSSHN